MNEHDNPFSHIDKHGNACMVNIASKPNMHRTAIAEGCIELQPATIELLQQKAMKKGDVLTVAKIAGIQAAKQTALLIPLCHQINLSNVDIDFIVSLKNITVRTTAICTAATGVEMEALTAASVALLTIYDMCKAVDKQMVISNIRLIEKTKQ